MANASAWIIHGGWGELLQVPPPPLPSNPLTSVAEVVLQHIQHVGHLGEEEDLVVIGVKPLQEAVDQHQLGASLNQVFPELKGFGFHSCTMQNQHSLHTAAHRLPLHIVHSLGCVSHSRLLYYLIREIKTCVHWLKTVTLGSVSCMSVG